MNLILTYLHKMRFLSITLLLFMSSCCTIQVGHQSHDLKPPIEAFLKVKTTMAGIPHSVGSAVLVKHVKGTSLVLTAEHICAGENKEFFLIHTDLQEYAAKVLTTHKDLDLCILQTQQRIPATPVKIAKQEPVYGEEVYNIAAPYGIHDNNMVLIYTGFYSGEKRLEDLSYSAYTISCGPGSSGSPVFNKSWDLVGVVSRKYHRLEALALASPAKNTLQALKILKLPIAKIQEKAL
jgi:S1-C subfamily serine protease